MGTVRTKAKAREARIDITVIRCGCGNPTSHTGQHCPRPRQIEDHGTVSYYHRNPLRRWWWHLNRWLCGSQITTTETTS